jgi:hypothetical protein
MFKKLIIFIVILSLNYLQVNSIECYSCINCEGPFNHFAASVVKCTLNDFNGTEGYTATCQVNILKYSLFIFMCLQLFKI